MGHMSCLTLSQNESIFLCDEKACLCPQNFIFSILMAILVFVLVLGHISAFFLLLLFNVFVLYC